MYKLKSVLHEAKADLVVLNKDGNNQRYHWIVGYFPPPSPRQVRLTFVHAKLKLTAFMDLINKL